MEDQFLKIGLDTKTVKNILKNDKLSVILKNLLDENQITTADKKIGIFYNCR